MLAAFVIVNRELSHLKLWSADHYSRSLCIPSPLNQFTIQWKFLKTFSQTVPTPNPWISKWKIPWNKIFKLFRILQCHCSEIFWPTWLWFDQILMWSHLELKGNRVSAKVCIKLGVDVDTGGLPGGVLHHEEELGHDLDDMPGLEDKVPFTLHRFRGKAPWDVRLRAQLPRWRTLQRTF